MMFGLEGLHCKGKKRGRARALWSVESIRCIGNNYKLAVARRPVK